MERLDGVQVGLSAAIVGRRDGDEPVAVIPRAEALRDPPMARNASELHAMEWRAHDVQPWLPAGEFEAGIARPIMLAIGRRHDQVAERREVFRGQRLRLQPDQAQGVGLHGFSLLIVGGQPLNGWVAIQCRATWPRVVSHTPSCCRT
jgi:hypothetical protein